jgi:aryl-alcohol dehydrogenase-like predicted oxidoreductase
LAWLVHRDPHIVPISGTRRIERLDENAAATAIALTEAEQRRIAGVLAEGTVAGSRYPAAGMATVNA